MLLLKHTYVLLKRPLSACDVFVEGAGAPVEHVQLLDVCEQMCAV
jgi:hypothetical protein